ncbi:SusC/RagA family TonB-linked outer membrane protein [Marinilabilia rubra]|uniref:SusC/RagA family protein n=1 Tax=Marinilabilia rubra TaxID=2162893 RepID=A0A2U2B8A1_9BACT|nr:TonB-dependent receptor [Marinilabilia rubra]PWD99287.1 SusC/RagA family protein [Marinilabilia rubra]
MKKQFNFYKILFLFLGLGLFISASAQEITVTGTVTDADNGEPLPGVTVVIKGTQQGAITQPDGTYSVQAPEEAVLAFSFIGYKTSEVAIDGQNVINVGLRPDVLGLEEVVVIGYGVSKKKDLTGSVQTVSADDFNQGSITSPQQLMNGKVAGVQITDGGGAPGSGTTIRIRGGSSLSASNDPLIIIDGVPIDNEDVSGMRNPLNVVNPNDIETFTVLKDASATAIYGSRASNGVILITTKKGKTGELKIDYTGKMSVHQPTEMVDVVDAGQYREMLGKFFPENTNLMGDASTDWQDEIYETAISTDHNIAFSGTVKDALPFRASVGYNNSNGILKKSSMERVTAALNLNPSFFGDHLRINTSLKGMSIKNNFSNEDAIGDAIAMDPTQPIKADEYDRFGGYYAWTNASGNPNNIAPQNAVARINQRTDLSMVQRFVGNFQADYKFHFLPELRANLNVGMDYSKSEDDGGVQTPANAAWDTEAFLRGGAYSHYAQEKRNELLDFYLQYTKPLDDIDSRIDVMGGYSWQHFWRNNEDEAYFNEADSEGSFVRDPYNLTKTENYLVSFFGRLNYVFKEKYFLTFTLRNDGSSRFSEENRWGLFPSMALAWNISDEAFLEQSSAVSNLKLRLGYGVTGQQNIGSDYGYFGTYRTGQPTAQYVYYNPQSGNYVKIPVTTLRPEGYDKNLKWEETTTYNVGLDYGFMNDRIYGSLDVYLRKTEDLLNEIPVPAGANLTNQLFTNVGNLENKGFEISLNTIPYESNDFTWELGANFTYNENEITKLTQVDDPNYLGVQHGGISGGTGNNIKIHQVGQPAGSFFVYEQVYDADGRPLEGVYVDQNEDGQINESDLYVAGSASPKYIIGLNTSLRYKNWDLSVSGRANLDMYVYNNMASNGAFYNKLQVNGNFLNNIHSDIYNTGFYDPNYFSDYYVQNASFFRLDNVTLGYNVNDLLNSGLKIRVYGSVDNVLVVSEYDGIDPEISDGIDNNMYPRPRTYMMGVNVSF